ncbi:hypothetical protein Dimus_033106 [Dionaea muscipula]
MDLFIHKPQCLTGPYIYISQPSGKQASNSRLDNNGHQLQILCHDSAAYLRCSARAIETELGSRSLSSLLSAGGVYDLPFVGPSETPWLVQLLLGSGSQGLHSSPCRWKSDPVLANLQLVTCLKSKYQVYGKRPMYVYIFINNQHIRKA